MENAERDSLKEKLGCVKNEMTHLWGTVFLFAGGSFSLVFTTHSLEAHLCGIIGIVFALIFLRAYMIRRDETVRIVDKLREMK